MKYLSQGKGHDLSYIFHASWLTQYYFVTFNKGSMLYFWQRNYVILQGVKCLCDTAFYCMKLLDVFQWNTGLRPILHQMKPNWEISWTKRCRVKHSATLTIQDPSLVKRACQSPCWTRGERTAAHPGGEGEDTANHPGGEGEHTATHLGEERVSILLLTHKRAIIHLW